MTAVIPCLDESRTLKPYASSLGACPIVALLGATLKHESLEDMRQEYPSRDPLVQ